MLRWPNTVFARAFADVIQHVHEDFKTTNMPSIERSFYLLNTRTICAIFSIIERSVLMTLVFYYKDMLEKVTMQRTQQFSAFVCSRKNPVKCNAFALAETCRFLTIQSLEFQEIWQKNRSETM